jgi:acyl dehydratase
MEHVHYLDNLTVGQRFGSGRQTVDASAIKRFAAEFDPQPFHMNEQEAKETIFQGLAASGWHTAAITMRLFVESEFKPAGGTVGVGLDELQWPRPVRPGDKLSLETEVLEIRPSKSRPEQGMVKVRVTTYNQKREVVQMFVANLVVKRYVP